MPGVSHLLQCYKDGTPGEGKQLQHVYGLKCISLISLVVHLKGGFSQLEGCFLSSPSMAIMQYKKQKDHTEPCSLFLRIKFSHLSVQ